MASYTFTFADGSNPVTQASPTISHTYNVPSGSSGFFATVTVNDQKCGQPSLNVASVQIEVGPASTAVKDKLPGRFGIFPMSNPSHGQTLFSLDLDREGLVSVQVISPDGRRVADLMNSWMPAGKHSLKWSGLDRSGNRSPAGFYVVRARSGNRVRATRVVLLP